MRREQSLSGTWEFGTTNTEATSVDNLQLEREIPVPAVWQAVFPELQQYSGYAWYRRTVDLDDGWLGGEVLLYFGAVDYWCEVFVNGRSVGTHEGGYTTFRFPVREQLRSGRNEIAVRVYDSTQEGIFIPRWPNYPDEDPNTVRPPFEAEDVPHGKQEWYINAGGIWQDVKLIAVPRRWIGSVRIETNIETGEVRFAIEVAGADEAATAQVRVASGGEEVGRATVAVPGAQHRVTGSITVQNPLLWDLDSPHLYTATVMLEPAGGGESDEVAVRFGFREISTRDGELLLNGKPIYLLSALDQDMYPETVYTVPSEEYLRDEFEKAKHLGLNCLRCHIKPPDPLYLDLADEMGLLVWAEIPSWRTFYIKGTLIANQLNLPVSIQNRVERTLAEMVERDFNHPSLVIWTIVNEDWGTTLPLSAADREWVAGMYEVCKSLDPTRLVVDNSACPHSWGPNIHVRTDLDDFHFYANIPDQSTGWESTVDQFNLRPVWTFSSHGDAKRTGQEPIILSEFGNWGLPSLEKLRRAHGGDDPPWFSTGPWWNSWEGEGGWPRGCDRRFRQLGLDKIWGDYEQFAEATQWHEFAALKFEIEAIRRQPNIKGYVITELADIYWESNGLLDFYRNPKVFHDVFAAINSPDVIAPRTYAYAGWSEGRVGLELHLSHYSPRDWSDARLRWAFSGREGELSLPAVARGETVRSGEYVWRLPSVDKGEMARLELAIAARGGDELVRNWLDLLVLPESARGAAVTQTIALVAKPRLHAGEIADMNTGVNTMDRPPEGLDGMQPDGMNVSGGESSADAGQQGQGQPSLRAALRRAGYSFTESLGPDVSLAVTDYPNAELLAWVRAGGDLLYIASGPSPFFWVQNRSGAYSGSWLTSFTWMRPDVHKRLPVHNPLGMPYRHVMPHGTILGLPLEDPAVHPDVLAGMVSGWVGHPAAHTVQFRYGKGRVLMTTFNLVPTAGVDPVATALLHDLLDHLSSGNCDPTLKANY